MFKNFSSLKYTVFTRSSLPRKPTSAPSPHHSRRIHPQDTKPCDSSFPHLNTSTLLCIPRVFLFLSLHPYPTCSLAVFPALSGCGFLVPLPSPSLALRFSCRLLSRFFRRLFPQPPSLLLLFLFVGCHCISVLVVSPLLHCILPPTLRSPSHLGFPC
ncbi:hypothetical protein DFH29DRAFT_41144 [Suillus ampliporus]|nr:hypothetical protein DFH29DRAFT_41144 [Suillus ampliporus]